MLPPRQDWVNKIMKKKIILWKEQLVVPKSTFYYPWCSQVTPTNFPTPTNCKPGYIETNDLGLEYKPWTHEWVNVARYAIRCRGLVQVKVWLRYGLYMFITRGVVNKCDTCLSSKTEELYIICWGNPYRFEVFGTLSLCCVSCMWWNHYHPLGRKLIFTYLEYISLQKITHIT